MVSNGCLYQSDDCPAYYSKEDFRPQVTLYGAAGAPQRGAVSFWAPIVEALRALSYHMLAMVSAPPMYGRSASGIAMLPSACW